MLTMLLAAVLFAQAPATPTQTFETISKSIHEGRRIRIEKARAKAEIDLMRSQQRLIDEQRAQATAAASVHFTQADIDEDGAGQSADGRIRIQVLVFGADSLTLPIQRDLEHRFETVPDVMAVTKAPDYTVDVLVSRPRVAGIELVAIAAFTHELPERALSAAILVPKANPDDIHNVGAILGSLGRSAWFDQFVGLESEVGNFASQIVANINQYVLAEERARPRGGEDRKTVFQNFMGRIGGTPVMAR